MATNRPPFPTLERLDNISKRNFATPTKRINDGDDLSFFFTSTAYRDITQWLLQLNRASFPTKRADGTINACTLDRLPELSSNVQTIRQLLADLSSLVTEAPPDTGPRRFGNVAFRTWYQLVEARTPALLDSHLNFVLHRVEDYEQRIALRDEIGAYLLGSFGSAQRLDNGTGHELSFLAFLGCLWKLGAFEAGAERAIVLGIVQPYLDLVRKLIMTYTLEPAGSHGVWGLDDHSFLPYIFGSAQLGPTIAEDDHTSPTPTEGSSRGAPSPSSVANKTVVSELKDTNMYFSAIQFIHDVKTGPFWEHSPTLYDISGITAGWGKINKGMLKMYAAEVLGKFPVVQHFPFGSIFGWDKDPHAVTAPTSVHSQQRPLQSKVMPPMVTNTPGTTAPWAKAGGAAMSQMQASTGRPTPASSSAVPATGMAAPRANAQRMPAQGLAPTAAPWAKRDAR
ncbi:hypothetical protein DOTSEDRAFT_84034 [Dothistroma septosporum NZE10]|uniref:Serine/threonine-protein phosphatase 2A activator n=1 Tax=Dothistroma septosporum (strain NZE10 / CBS 128990) TaxID=675120 RepID=N1PY74_DOTSN|nr:hypothetical protein DOTSEDRAFT_84034 [Dothistroma septosporum NZE10]